MVKNTFQTEKEIFEHIKQEADELDARELEREMLDYQDMMDGEDL